MHEFQPRTIPTDEIRVISHRGRGINSQGLESALSEMESRADVVQAECILGESCGVLVRHRVLGKDSIKLAQIDRYDLACKSPDCPYFAAEAGITDSIG